MSIVLTEEKAGNREAHSCWYYLDRATLRASTGATLCPSHVWRVCAHICTQKKTEADPRAIL
eukprot:IDg11857t1